MGFTKLFCDVDDFCKVFQPLLEQRQIELAERHRKRRSQLSRIGCEFMFGAAALTASGNVFCFRRSKVDYPDGWIGVD